MITREEAFAWMDRQVDAYNMSRETVGGIRNLSPYDDGVHVFGIMELANAIGYPFIRSYHSHDTDMLHFRYRGVEFFGVVWDKRIGKKTA